MHRSKRIRGANVSGTYSASPSRGLQLIRRRSHSAKSSIPQSTSNNSPILNPPSLAQSSILGLLARASTFPSTSQRTLGVHGFGFEVERLAFGIPDEAWP